MRIAVFADVHSNALALEAVLADLARRGGADVLVDLGDTLSGPLWPRRTAEIVGGLDCLAVRGNHDRYIGAGDAGTLGSWDRFAVEDAGPETCRAFAERPLSLQVAPGVLAFHAQPGKDDAYLLEDVQGGRLVPASPEISAERLGDAPGRIFLSAHSHLPRISMLADGRLVVNPGSAGCPAYLDDDDPAHVSESGTPHARYAILTLKDGGIPAVDLLAVPYDHEAAAQRALQQGMPSFAVALRTGRTG